MKTCGTRKVIFLERSLEVPAGSYVDAPGTIDIIIELTGDNASISFYKKYPNLVSCIVYKESHSDVLTDLYQIQLVGELNNREYDEWIIMKLNHSHDTN